MATAEKQTQFSWRRGLLHALVPFGLAIVGGLVAAFAADVPSDQMEAAGERTGTVAALALLLGLATSYFTQVRRTAWAWTAGIVSLLVVAGAVATPFLERGRVQSRPLTAADRRAPSLVDGRVVHDARGFSLALPDPGMSESAMAFPGPRDDAIAVWIYTRDDDMPLAVVQLQRFNRVTEASLREFVRGVRGGFLSSVNMDVDIQDETLTWEPSFKGYHLRAVAEVGASVHVAAWVLPGDEYVVVVLLFGEDDSALSKSVDSFQMGR